MCKKGGGWLFSGVYSIYGHNLKSEIFTEVTASYSNDVLNCITVTTVALGTGKQDRNGNGNRKQKFVEVGVTEKMVQKWPILIAYKFTDCFWMLTKMGLKQLTLQIASRSVTKLQMLCPCHG